MKAVNAAYSFFADYDWTSRTEHANKESTNNNWSQQLWNALLKIKHLPNINIEVCGSWIWITGESKPHKDIIKDAGFKFSGKKQAWFLNPTGYKSYNRGKWSLDEIRSYHGSTTVQKDKQQLIAA